MSKIRVAVLRGGPSDEYEVSLQTGAAVLKHIPEEIYHPLDIFISREGVWHEKGIPVSIDNVLSRVDVVFNALHGQYGEDGKIQHILEVHQIPYTGSRSFASALAMNKALAKSVYAKEGLKTPQSRILSGIHNLHERIMEVFKAFPLPVIIKPVGGGSSVGLKLVKDFASFKEAVTEALEKGQTVLMEEYIKGREATVGVIDQFRGQELYALPAVEIRPHSGGIFDYSAKYEGKSDEIVPGNFTHEEKKELEGLAILAHKALGLRHYSRSDFIIHPHRGIFILESNTLPGLTDESLIPKALNSVGAPLPLFIDHLLVLALDRK